MPHALSLHCLQSLRHGREHLCGSMWETVDCKTWFLHHAMQAQKYCFILVCLCLFVSGWEMVKLMVEEDKVARLTQQCWGQYIMWNCTNCFRCSHENMIKCTSERKIVSVSFYVLTNEASEATQGPLPEIRVLSGAVLFSGLPLFSKI